MWFIYAFLAAIAAALVAVFGKIGLLGVDTTLATTIRSIIMAVILILVSLIGGKFTDIGSISARSWAMITFAGFAGAASWLFYFLALKLGTASHVAAIDRLSIVFVILFAVIFLGEIFTWKLALGGAFMAVGAMLIAF